jgi:type IV pilus assembly protein PilQ
VILLSNSLGKTLEGNILRVAPIDRLTKEKQAAIAAREAASKLEPIKKGLIPVSYAQARELKSVVTNAKVLSPRGSLEVDERTNTIIVLDVEDKIQEVRRIVYQLDAPTPQVLIEAKVAQINPTFTRELGITWDAGYNTTSGKDGVIGVGGAGGTTIDPATGQVTTTGSIVDLAPAVGQGIGGGMSWAYLDNAFGLSQKLAALEKEEKAEILSSPRIMTLDNQEALIEQGVDLPYLKLSEQGVTSTEFKKATLSLKVIPHVTSDGSIMMDVEVKKEQRSAQTGAGGAPGIDTRRATTKVLVRDKTTVVIGGIYEETTSDTKNSVPFLGRVPVVKWLFSSSAKKRDKTELIVFITPTIITIPKKPLTQQELQGSPES